MIKIITVNVTAKDIQYFVERKYRNIKGQDTLSHCAVALAIRRNKTVIHVDNVGYKWAKINGKNITLPNFVEANIYKMSCGTVITPFKFKLAIEVPFNG